MTELHSFVELASKLTRPYTKWCMVGNVHIYLRARSRIIEQARVKVLDIGSVEVIAEKRGQGEFTKILDELERINPFPVLYIENVLNQRFADFFERRGYVRDVHFPDDLCFYLRK